MLNYFFYSFIFFPFVCNNLRNSHFFVLPYECSNWTILIHIYIFIYIFRIQNIFLAIFQIHFCTLSWKLFSNFILIVKIPIDRCFNSIFEFGKLKVRSEWAQFLIWCGFFVLAICFGRIKFNDAFEIESFCYWSGHKFNRHFIFFINYQVRTKIEN